MLRIPNLRTLALGLFLAPAALAHCDGWDGPVVADAQRALAQRDVRLVLHWVPKTDETAVREAFDRTQAVRRAGGEAQRLADQFFFETLVRLHRAGEGAPFTGLKPAGRDVGRAIPAGDLALKTGDLKPVWALIQGAAHTRLHARFDAARKAQAFQPGDVEAGRRFVAAYVDYIHHVEALHALAEGAAAPGSPNPPHACDAP